MANESSALVSDVAMLNGGNSGRIEFPSGTQGLVFKIVDVKGPSNYTAGGIAVGTYSATNATNLTNTQTALVMDSILGAVLLGIYNSSDGTAKTTGFSLAFVPASGRLILLANDGSGVANAALPENTTADVSSYTFRVLFIGHSSR